MFRLIRCFTGCILVALAVGCATPSTEVISDPEGAFIKVNGNGLGTSPQNFTFDLGKLPVYQVSASKDGYFDSNLTVDANSNAIQNGVLKMALQPDPSWQETTVSDATNRWLHVQVSAGITQDEAWQKIIDSVTSRYASLEQLDSSSGYLRSTLISRTFKNPMTGDFTIRTQFLGAIASKDPLVYKMQIRAEQSTPSGDWVPYDRVFKEDAQLIDELQNRLGLK
ncbi:MAG TPA: PEGA domain-containing protein [Tepidisphaeraceae bacterium]|nr:PEGA domain-containing protein [Tepidisphaeraceae bacterium]